MYKAFVHFCEIIGILSLTYGIFQSKSTIAFTRVLLQQ